MVLPLTGDSTLGLNIYPTVSGNPAQETATVLQLEAILVCGAENVFTYIR